MAFPSSTTILLLFLLYAAAVPPSHADLITIHGVEVTGRLFCSATGNPCPTCEGMAGVDVTITCNINGSTTSNCSTLTDASGLFNTVVDIVDGLLFGNTSLACFVSVELPIAQCTLLPPTGILRAPLTFQGNVMTGAIGLVAETVLGLFGLVPQ
ncbi:uncharacterized protein [Henckelia pumila]|uniref:uncharacterized protein n=1 Tax=Henckelia pumila TaxID=405737 RepID=UPI003C6E9CAF